MGNLIYVSISCLGIDTELVKTIKNCYASAENPENIYFGVACIGDKDFFDQIKNELKDIKNIKYGYYDVDGNLGLGFGRNIAASFYNNEDYFLQIDPHSRFAKSWDSFLIKKFNLAQRNVNNQKVVLSGYCPPYFYINEDKQESSFFPILEYSPLKLNEFWNDGVIPKWTNISPNELPTHLKQMIEHTGMAPAFKVCAHFIFSNKFFARNTCLYKDIFFWEEELLQSVELIDNGFTLIYPGIESPVYHFYNDLSNGIDGYRDTNQKFLPTAEDKKMYIKNMEKNYIKHVQDKNNYQKIKNFEKYNSTSLTDGSKTNNSFPTEYANIGFLPVVESI